MCQLQYSVVINLKFCVPCIILQCVSDQRDVKGKGKGHPITSHEGGGADV